MASAAASCGAASSSTKIRLRHLSMDRLPGAKGLLRQEGSWRCGFRFKIGVLHHVEHEERVGQIDRAPGRRREAQEVVVVLVRQRLARALLPALPAGVQ